MGAGTEKLVFPQLSNVNKLDIKVIIEEYIRTLNNKQMKRHQVICWENIIDSGKIVNKLKMEWAVVE